MCYIATPYYLHCGCYGRATLLGEACIRATASRGLSSGCWDRIDMGVESVNRMCPKCQRSSRMMDVPSMCIDDLECPNSNSGSPTATKGTSSAHSRNSSTASTTSTSSRLSTNYHRSTSECASQILSFLPPSVKTRKTPSTRNSELWKPGSIAASEAFCGREQVTSNLHWRTFNDARYEDFQESTRGV